MTVIYKDISTTVASDESLSHVDNREDAHRFDRNREPSGENVLTFPINDLFKVDEQVNQIRWVVHVMAESELDNCLRAAIKFAKAGLADSNEYCKRFMSTTLLTCFSKILVDDAVSSWRNDTYRCIYDMTLLFLELAVYKLEDDHLQILEVLAMAFNPDSRFHNATTCKANESTVIDSPYCCNVESQPLRPRGFLMNFIDYFGKLDGFTRVRNRFISEKSQPLNLTLIVAYLRPFGNCYMYLKPEIIENFLVPIIKKVYYVLQNLGVKGEQRKDDSKDKQTEFKSDGLGQVLKWINQILLNVVPGHEKLLLDFETLRLDLILRMLKMNLFNEKMNALIEINKMISNISSSSSYQLIMYGQRNNKPGEGPSAERLTKWIQDNKVLEIVLQDCLHQPQYVEKLERFLRFAIKQNSLSLADLDLIWMAQNGRHEAIEKNLHDLLAKLAYDFSSQQLNYLFHCFTRSWAVATVRQRERLLLLIQKLAEEDKHGNLISKVFDLLWQISHDDALPTEIIDYSLATFNKIMDHISASEKSPLIKTWIERLIAELKNDRWAILVLRQIKELCNLFPDNDVHHVHSPAWSRIDEYSVRVNFVTTLQEKHNLIELVVNNLAHHMMRVKSAIGGNAAVDPYTLCIDSRYNHVVEVSERLEFIRFVLKENRTSHLDYDYADQIWRYLAADAIFPSDRDICFAFFERLVSEDFGMDRLTYTTFFTTNLLQLDPKLFTDNGMSCFERFFRAVNITERSTFDSDLDFISLEDELIGKEHLWEILLHAPESSASRALNLFKDVYAQASSGSAQKQREIHSNFLATCFKKIACNEPPQMLRILVLLRDYITECDRNFDRRRKYIPLYRAWRGFTVEVIAHASFHSSMSLNSSVDDIEIDSHANETCGNLRRIIIKKLDTISLPRTSIEMSLNNCMVDYSDDMRVLADYNVSDRTDVKVVSYFEYLNHVYYKLMSRVQPSVTGQHFDISSPDSSNSGSDADSNHEMVIESDASDESCLPSTIMSKTDYYKILLDISESHRLDSSAELSEAARIVLEILPPAQDRVIAVRNCLEQMEVHPGAATLFEFFSGSPSQILYDYKVLLTQIIPSEGLTDENLIYPRNFLLYGGLHFLFSSLASYGTIMDWDKITKRAELSVTIQLLKFCLAFLHTYKRTSAHKAVLNSLSVMIDPFLESVSKKIIDSSIVPEEIDEFRITADHLSSVIKIAWSLAAGGMNFIASYDEIHQHFSENASKADCFDISLSRNALNQILPLVALCEKPFDLICGAKFWSDFILDLGLLCKAKSIRTSVITVYYKLAMFTCECSDLKFRVSLIDYLFDAIKNKATEFPNQASELFSLLCSLISLETKYKHISLPNATTFLKEELEWLNDAKAEFMKNGCLPFNDILLEGHLFLISELLSLQSSNQLHYYGSASDGPRFVDDIMCNFLFPASRHLNTDLHSDLLDPICTSAESIVAAFEVIVTLCRNCLQNMECACKHLMQLFYMPLPTTREWDFTPSFNSRAPDGFVGLKNACATCYMNSVIQQLFMIKPLREAILLVNLPPISPLEDSASNIDENRYITDVDNIVHVPSFVSEIEVSHESNNGESQKRYHLEVFKNLQLIFGHLLESKVQYYIPHEFWRTFKFYGEPVNIREQHDAVEFLQLLVDSIDEALKACGLPPLYSKIIGGVFADQKICQDCPHRYTREENFVFLSVNIQHAQNLQESLEQYVRGELLEGPNAYHCEKCNKKVNTVKRTYIKKLPHILIIQLKRFDYDWERETAVKFNDYFEFSRELDMEPYTLQGSLKAEGVECDKENDLNCCTKYRLVGIIVHSGQANGGHYYSFIYNTNEMGKYGQWYKFDDIEVCDSKIDDDEELKNLCFGGDYAHADLWDSYLKRQQRKWWNGYILFYERFDSDKNFVLDNLKSLSKDKINRNMPAWVERLVRQQNNKFFYEKSQFSGDYFNFIKNLVECNVSIAANAIAMKHNPDFKLSNDDDQICHLSVEIGISFLFALGWHTRKQLPLTNCHVQKNELSVPDSQDSSVRRYVTVDWVESLANYLLVSDAARNFLCNVLVHDRNKILLYLLECSNVEVRMAFSNLLVVLAHALTEADPKREFRSLFPDNRISCSLDYRLISAVLYFLKDTKGRNHCALLLQLQVPSLFINMVLGGEDILSTPYSRYHISELHKLHLVVVYLMRCYDLSSICSTNGGTKLMPNPYQVEPCKPIMNIPADVVRNVLKRDKYIKILMSDENCLFEDLQIFIQFCCWENIEFTHMILSLLMSSVFDSCGDYLDQCNPMSEFNYSLTIDFHPIFELIRVIINLNDSWREKRILLILKGGTYDRFEVRGLIDRTTLKRSFNYKKCYLAMKILVQTFESYPSSKHIFDTDDEVRKFWINTCHFLKERFKVHENTYLLNLQNTDDLERCSLDRPSVFKQVLDKASEYCIKGQQNPTVEETTNSSRPNSPVLKNTANKINFYQPQSSAGREQFKTSHFLANRYTTDVVFAYK